MCLEHTKKSGTVGLEVCVETVASEVALVLLQERTVHRSTFSGH